MIGIPIKALKKDRNVQYQHAATPLLLKLSWEVLSYPLLRPVLGKDWDFQKYQKACTKRIGTLKKGLRTLREQVLISRLSTRRF